MSSGSSSSPSDLCVEYERRIIALIAEMRALRLLSAWPRRAAADNKAGRPSRRARSLPTRGRPQTARSVAVSPKLTTRHLPPSCETAPPSPAVSRESSPCPSTEIFISRSSSPAHGAHHKAPCASAQATARNPPRILRRAGRTIPESSVTDSCAHRPDRYCNSTPVASSVLARFFPGFVPSARCVASRPGGEPCVVERANCVTEIPEWLYTDAAICASRPELSAEQVQSTLVHAQLSLESAMLRRPHCVGRLMNPALPLITFSASAKQSHWPSPWFLFRVVQTLIMVVLICLAIPVSKLPSAVAFSVNNNAANVIAHVDAGLDSLPQLVELHTHRLQLAVESLADRVALQATFPDAIVSRLGAQMRTAIENHLRNPRPVDDEIKAALSQVKIDNEAQISRLDHTSQFIASLAPPQVKRLPEARLHIRLSTPFVPMVKGALSAIPVGGPALAFAFELASQPTVDLYDTQAGLYLDVFGLKTCHLPPLPVTLTYATAADSLDIRPITRTFRVPLPKIGNKRSAATLAIAGTFPISENLCEHVAGLLPRLMDCLPDMSQYSIRGYGPPAISDYLPALDCSLPAFFGSSPFPALGFEPVHPMVDPYALATT
jgi:hypothetical protein